MRYTKTIKYTEPVPVKMWSRVRIFHRGPPGAHGEIQNGPRVGPVPTAGSRYGGNCKFIPRAAVANVRFRRLIILLYRAIITAIVLCARHVFALSYRQTKKNHTHTHTNYRHFTRLAPLQVLPTVCPPSSAPFPPQIYRVTRPCFNSYLHRYSNYVCHQPAVAVRPLAIDL